MKKGIIIGVIAVIIAVGSGYFAYSHSENSKVVTNNSNVKTTESVKKVESSNIKKKNAKSDNKTEVTTNLGFKFSVEGMNNYYKLSQNVGDIGLPSASMTTNLENYKTIDGVNYYSTYSYDTRAAYKNDTSTPKAGNYSHMINSKIISLDGKTISSNQFGIIDSSNLSDLQLKNQIYKVAAMYLEGYTANDPTLVVSSNDNYEGNLNAVPEMSINLDEFKDSGKGKLYEVTASLNGYKTPIYVGIDGYIYVTSENNFNQLFFPNKLS